MLSVKIWYTNPREYTHSKSASPSTYGRVSFLVVFCDCDAKLLSLLVCSFR